MPLLPELVMDNAAYHSRKIMKVQHTGTQKVEIMEWLRSNNVSVNESMTRAELLYEVEVIRPV